jgi:mono/diheme cytochrome c family protein
MIAKILCIALFLAVAGAWLSGGSAVWAAENPSGENLAAALGIHFIEGSRSTVLLERDGKQYLVDVAAKTVRESAAPPAGGNGQPDGAAIFKQRCATCHGTEAQGIEAIGTPNFTDPAVLGSLTDDQVAGIIRNGKAGTKGMNMPAWAGKLTAVQIAAVTAYLRSVSSAKGPATRGEGRSTAPANIYQAGDDVLMNLPTGRRRAEHGLYVNFSHRFAFDPTFRGPARGGDLFGLDGFSLSSLGFGYGVTRNFSVDVFRSPTFIGRPIQMMAAYHLLDEQDHQPFNLAVRFSVEGRNDFSRQFTENIEGIFSRSLTRRAQFYAVPTISFNDRRLVQPTGVRSFDIPSVPGINSFALGFGLAVDIRPTVALIAEVIPTLIGGDELDIHRPSYAFGIQKKIFRHAFTLGFTNTPGRTVSQRAGTLASYTGMAGADTPGGLILGFDLTRQLK